MRADVVLACDPRPRQLLEPCTPAGDPVELHLVMNNYAAHKHTKVKAWLVENPRFVVHFTPTYVSVRS